MSMVHGRRLRTGAYYTRLCHQQLKEYVLSWTFFLWGPHYWTCWQQLTVFCTTLLPSSYHHPEIFATHRDDLSSQARITIPWLLTPFYFCNSFVWPWPLSTPWLSSILPHDTYFVLTWCWELCFLTLSCSLCLSACPWLHSLSKDF